MGNHLHLLLQEGKESLEQIFKRIGVRYVYWYNWKYKRTGHLFQDRFKSEPVNDDAYFLAVLRYIYQNPVKAGLCKQPADYLWSSYNSTDGHSTLAMRTKALELLPEADLHRFSNEPCEQAFLDIEREAIALIKRICKGTAATDFTALPAEQQIKHLHKLCEGRCTIRQLSRLLGMDRMKISRMVSQ